MSLADSFAQSAFAHTINSPTGRIARVLAGLIHSPASQPYAALQGGGMKRLDTTLGQALIPFLLLSAGCQVETTAKDKEPPFSKAASSSTVTGDPFRQAANIQDQPELHVIGVQHGSYPPGTDTRPWWQKCKDDPSVKNDSDCHQKYAGQRDKSFARVNVTYTAAPVILALLGADPVEWTVSIDPASKVKRVILAGQYRQEIKGIDKSIPIEVYNREPFGCENCTQLGPGFYAYDEKTGDYISGMKRLFEITGMKPSSVQLAREGIEGGAFYVSPTVKPYSELPAAFKRWETWH